MLVLSQIYVGSGKRDYVPVDQREAGDGKLGATPSVVQHGGWVWPTLGTVYPLNLYLIELRNAPCWRISRAKLDYDLVCFFSAPSFCPWNLAFILDVNYDAKVGILLTFLARPAVLGRVSSAADSVHLGMQSVDPSTVVKGR